MPDAIRLVNIGEDRSEASNCCRGITIGTRYGEGRFGDVAPHGSEQPRLTECSEDIAVGGIAKEHGQPSLGAARRRSLRKAQTGCFELAPSGIQEHEERIYRGRRIQNIGVATIPVDFSPALFNGPWIVEVVVP